METIKTIRLLIRITIFAVVLVTAAAATLVLYSWKPALFHSRKAEIAVVTTADPAHWTPKTMDHELPAGERGQAIRYGYLLITETPKYIGPMVEDKSMLYSGNNLACKNCHLQNGTQPGSGSWVGVTERFPQFRGRENKIGTIEDRVNGCMERSMNGKKLPVASKEMKAIVAYMEWLSEDVPKEKVAEYKGFPSIKIPDIAADPALGKVIYVNECQVCHGENGQGVKLADSTKGYQFPPLWGSDSYNHGAGMHRVLTAAGFIKGNMPFGQATWDKPKLTDEEAYHVAAYINSFDRPQKANTEADFPDRKLKPVSTPYGPWEDTFPASQHKYGPYPPIIKYYQDKYNIKKTK